MPSGRQIFTLFALRVTAEPKLPGAVIRRRVFTQPASEMAQHEPVALVTYSNPGVLAAKQATTTIPIVMLISGDAVGSGLVASLSRHSGNVTVPPRRSSAATTSLYWAADLSPKVPPLGSRVPGCCHAHRDGVSRFGDASTPTMRTAPHP